MDAADFALNAFKTELETSRDIDNRAKYLASGAAIFMGIIINSLLSDQAFFDVSFPVIFTAVLFLVCFYTSVSVTVSHGFYFMPNSITHSVFSEKNNTDINNLTSPDVVNILYSQSEILYMQNIRKTHTLYKSYAFFLFGIVSAFMSLSYISSEYSNYLLCIYVPLAFIFIYLLYKEYKSLPKAK